MLSAMEKGELIRQRREALGWSQAELGKRIGTSQTAVGKIEAGTTKRSRFFPELARVLSIPIAELNPAFAEPSDVGAFIPNEALVGRKDNLPVYGSAEGGSGALIVDYNPIDYVRRPANLEHVRGGYGILVVGESMVPVVEPGHILLINPHVPPQARDVAVFYRTFLDETVATVKTYLSQTQTEWRVCRWHPKESRFTLPRDEWRDCHVRVGQITSRR